VSDGNSTVKGYFSTNLESVRKDVECTFGILKKSCSELNEWLASSSILNETVTEVSCEAFGVFTETSFNKHLENVLLKANECVNQGYLYEIWIYDYKGNKIIKTF
jgi:hypothetical protein